MLLQNKTALITGGAQGVGLAIALAFGKEGAAVVLADIHPREETLAQLRACAPAVRSFQCDVTDEAQVVRLFAEAGPIDILVNNAGTYGPVKKIVDMDRAAWDRTFAVNLTSAMMCSREVLRGMIERRSGNIVNIASNVARRGLPYRGCYVATKWAMLGLTQTLALETAEYGIRVNSILPGPVPTPHLEEVMKLHAEVDRQPVEAVAEAWRVCAPMKRFIEPEEVASVAVFLASPMSSAMTGQGINVTCGFIMT